jgi:hypothetical protein
MQVAKDGRLLHLSGHFGDCSPGAPSASPPPTSTPTRPN